jgi:hypothetical protein
VDQTQFPKLRGHYERVAARPATRKVLALEGG